LPAEKNTPARDTALMTDDDILDELRCTSQDLS